MLGLGQVRVVLNNPLLKYDFKKMTISNAFRQ